MQKLSVIIPLYNKANTIDILLDGLLGQSIALDIIIVNDMSTDNSEKIVLEKAKNTKNHSIRLFNNNTKRYAMQSRIYGLQFAKYEYCLFVDADDEIVGTHNLEKALQEVSEKQADIGHFRTLGRTWQGKELFQDAPNTSPFGKELHGMDIFKHYLDRPYIPANLWGKIFKTSFIKEIAQKVKNVRIMHFDDKCMVSIAMLFAKSYIGSFTEIYHYTYSNNWTQKRFAIGAQDLYTIIDIMVPLMEEQQCPQELQEKFIRYIRRRITVNAGQLSIQLMKEIEKNPNKIYDIIEELSPYIDKENLLQALILANAENAHNIIRNFETIKGLPHVS